MLIETAGAMGGGDADVVKWKRKWVKVVGSEEERTQRTMGK